MFPPSPPPVSWSMSLHEVPALAKELAGFERGGDMICIQTLFWSGLDEAEELANSFVRLMEEHTKDYQVNGARFRWGISVRVVEEPHDGFIALVQEGASTCFVKYAPGAEPF